MILWSIRRTDAARHKCLPHSGPCSLENVGAASGREEVSKLI